jgi:hypothetical protein
VDARDADGDLLTFEYSWEIGDTRLSPTADVLPHPEHRRGDRVRVGVVASDGRTTSERAVAEVTIGNAPPGAPAIVIEPSPARSEFDMRCRVVTPAVDPDGDTVTYRFSWTRDGVAWTGDTAQTVHPADTIRAAHSARGEVWRCSVSAFDGEDEGPAASVAATVSAWTGPRTFTNCGQTGHLGPSQSQCDTAYRSTSLEDDELIVTFGIQEWVVPLTGRYRVSAYGAQGISADLHYLGGKGAEISGVFELEDGDRLYIAVGQEGIEASCNGGGGGGTWVMDSEFRPMIVAGGGGGSRSIVFSPGCGGRISELAGVGSGGRSTSDCAEKTSGLRSGGIVSQHNFGSAGGGIGSNGAGDLSSDNGGKSWANGLVGGGSTSYPAYGGFGGGGSGAGACGGGGGGGYSGGDGGYLGGGGGSYNAGTSKIDKADSNAGHGKVVIDLDL